MEKQIQELTDKLYKEGVVKGNAQAEVIIADAKQNAAKIVADAKAEAEALMAKAQKKSEELKNNTTNELKLYAGQTLEAVQTSVTNMLTNKIVEAAVKAPLNDDKFMQDVIMKLVTTWGEKEEIVIGTADAEALKAYFAKQGKNLLDQGVSIEQVNGKPHSFSVAPADGSYKIVFGKDEFAELFKEFLRPSLIDMLFK